MHNLALIAAFSKVADSNSFTEAAAQLGMSKPTVSKHITTLEKNLGVRLINRTTRSIRLTEIGADFYAHCQRILAELEAAEAEVLQACGRPRGRVRVQVSTSLGYRWLASELREFLNRYSEIEIDLKMTRHAINGTERDIDLEIRIMRHEPSSSRARRLFPCAHLVCGAPRYLEEFGTPVTLRDLRLHNCLINTQDALGDNWRLHGPKGAESVKVSGRFHADNEESLYRAILSGVGLGLMPSLLVDEDIRANCLVHVLPDFQDIDPALYLVYPYDGEPPAKVRAVVNYLEERLNGRSRRDP